MNTFADEITGKKVLIFGLGRQGGGAGDAEWLARQGAIVKISDRDLTLCPEGQTESQINWAEIIIKNPGVPDEHPLLILAKKLQKPVLTSIALFVKYAPIKTIGITGTRGKSTTTALISALLERAFPGKVVIGGNIPGTSGLSLFDQIEDKEYAVLELSSFQLHNFHDLHTSPQIAIITNMYPDHLNRYPNMEGYQKDKEAIVMYQKQTDLTLYNRDNPGAVAISQVSSGQAYSYAASEVSDWVTTLPGQHNRENIAAMWSFAQVHGIPEDLCKKVVRDFHGLPFRQEKIRELEGVSYINDTTSTTPTATLKAIAAQTKPTIILCGGATKNLPFDLLVTALAENRYIEKVIFLGSKQIPDFTQAVKHAAPTKILGQVDSMAAGVALAKSVAKPGMTILLSPGFASFDLFQNEFDRGRQFNEVVKQL